MRCVPINHSITGAGTRSLRAAICCMASLAGYARSLVHAASSRRKQPELTFNLATQWELITCGNPRFDRYVSAIRARLDPHEVELSGDFAILRKARVIVTFGLCAMSPAATAQDPTPFLVDTTATWVERSNTYAQILIGAEAQFRPESFSDFGIPGYDDRVVDLRADNAGRFRSAVASAKSELQEKLKIERDPSVREDLEIMIAAAADDIESSELQEQLVLPWADVPQLIFEGLRGLLSEQTAAKRRTHALDRLKRYVGFSPDAVPLMTLAKQRYEERTDNGALLHPARREVEQALRNNGLNRFDHFPVVAFEFAWRDRIFFTVALRQVKLCWTLEWNLLARRYISPDRSMAAKRKRRLATCLVRAG